MSEQLWLFDGPFQLDPSSNDKRSKEKVIEKLNRYIFGDDIFISYSRADAAIYAAGLANELVKLKFTCKIDQWGTQPGKELPRPLKRSIRSSALFVLIGTEEAVKSDPVRQEIVLFKKSGRLIVPINFNNAVRRAVWWSDVEGLYLSPEEEEALKTGNPSAAIVNRIEKTFKFTRRDQRLRRTSLVVALILLALTVGTVVAMIQARRERLNANAAIVESIRQKEIADGQKKIADIATSNAEIQKQIAKDKTEAARISDENARKQQGIAKQKTKEAERQQFIAQQQQTLAQQMTAKAKEEEENSKRLLYAANMVQADSLYRLGDVNSMISLLGGSKPEPPSFEWNYLNHLNEGIANFNTEKENKIDNLLFSPSGKYLITTGDTSPLLVWNAQTGEKTGLDVHDKSDDDDDAAPPVIAFSPDEKWFASCTSGSGFILWDTTTSPWKKSSLSFPTQSDSAAPEVCQYVSFTQDNKVLLTVGKSEHGDYVLRHWDVQTKTATGDPKPIKPGENLSVLGFVHDELLLVRYDKPDAEARNAHYVSGLDQDLKETFESEVPDLTDTLYAFSRGAIHMAVQQKGVGINIYKRIAGSFVRQATVWDNPKAQSRWIKIKLSGDGGYLATLSDKNVKVWDTETGKIVRVIPLRKNIAKSVAFTSDSWKLAVGGYDEDEYDPSLLALWDINSQADVFNFDGEKPLAIPADGLKIVTLRYTDINFMKLWELNLWDTLKREKFKITQAPVTEDEPLARLSPDGNHAALLFESSIGKHSLQLWNTLTRREVGLSSKTECKFTPAMAFSSDSKWLLDICEDDTLRVWSVDDGSESHKLELEKGTVKNPDKLKEFGQPLRFLQKEKQLMALSPSDDLVEVWDPATGLRREFKVCGNRVFKISPDGKWVVTVDGESNYDLLNLAIKRCSAEGHLVENDEPLDSMAFSNDSKFLAIRYDQASQGGVANAYFTVKDLNTMKDMNTEEFVGIDNGTGVQFSLSGRWAQVGNKYWDTRTMKVHPILGCTGSPTFSVDEKRLMTSCESGAMSFWDLESGQEILNIQAHKSPVSKMVLMPGNNYLLTASGDDVKLWRTRF